MRDIALWFFSINCSFQGIFRKNYFRSQMVNEYLFNKIHSEFQHIYEKVTEMPLQRGRWFEYFVHWAILIAPVKFRIDFHFAGTLECFSCLLYTRPLDTRILSFKFYIQRGTRPRPIKVCVKSSFENRVIALRGIRFVELLSLRWSDVWNILYSVEFSFSSKGLWWI